MLAVGTSLIVQLALVANSAQPYDAAYQQAEAHGQPLLVLIGADWCPGCRTMKGSVLARMERGGRLSNVSYATINTDAQSDLAGQMMRGGMIPQLIVFSRKADGQWHREQLTGTASEGQVAGLLERARRVQAQAIAAQPSSASAVGN
jgi:thioredoxin-like negative regulator of GroEL